MDYKLVKTGRKSARMRNTATNSIALVSNDISIFADTPCVMQKLLDVVKEFTKWCGMKINVKKQNLLLVGKDQQQEEDTLAPRLWINGKRLNTKNEGQVQVPWILGNRKW